MGAEHTIDTRVDVMRAEKRRGGRWLPVGMWSTYANHATINKYQFRYYNPDHHGAAVMYAERKLRQRGKVPFGQRVVNLYGNGAEGDMSAALTRSGPAAAEHVGLREGKAMLRAWTDAEGSLTRRPEVDMRSTKLCFCGQQTASGPVDDEPKLGLAEFTGSDEARGPLYDVTRVPFEGRTAPVSSGPQGNKLIVELPLDVPQAAPISVMRIGSRLIGTVPGEATKETGVRIREALLDESRGTGIKRVVVAGLVNEYLSYFTTPEEYSAGHYEGAATLYGENSAVAVTESLSELAGALAEGKPGPPSFQFDQTNGIADNGEPFPEGAREATAIAQPDPVGRRLGAVTFSWLGGPRGYDRPLDKAFIRVQRKQRHGKRHWKTVDKDLGLHVLWFVDDEGHYTTRWEPSLGAAPGIHRIVVAGRHYRLRSDRFRLRPLNRLRVKRARRRAGRLRRRAALPAGGPPRGHRRRASRRHGQPAPPAPPRRRRQGALPGRRGARRGAKPQRPLRDRRSRRGPDRGPGRRGARPLREPQRLSGRLHSLSAKKNAVQGDSSACLARSLRAFKAFRVGSRVSLRLAFAKFLSLLYRRINIAQLRKCRTPRMPSLRKSSSAIRPIPFPPHPIPTEEPEKCPI